MISIPTMATVGCGEMVTQKKRKLIAVTREEGGRNNRGILKSSKLISIY